MRATDNPLDLIASIVARRRRDDDPEAVAQLIIGRLAIAGYEIRAKPEMIPIRPNHRCAVQFPLLALNPDLSASARQVKPPLLVLP
jgi:hypothetical protein